MTRPQALLFDFDGVLLESEFAGNRQIAEFLTAAGHPTSAADSMANFMGLSGTHFTQAIERWVSGPIPAGFFEARAIEDARTEVETAAGVADPRGLRQFLVGTGGKSHYAVASAQPNSEVRDGTTHGVLELKLAPTGYTWRFVPAAGGTFTDAGSAACF